MKLEEATAFTARCFQGEPASCTLACPFRLDIRAFLQQIARGRWAAAYKTFRNAVVFPGIVSILCDRPCTAHCQRTQLNDEPIDLGLLEAACLRYTKKRQPEVYAIKPKEQVIAVVGAGVAGLSCALMLAQKSYQVKVFEKERDWGGVLRTHPRFEEMDREIALQFSVYDVDFRFGTEIKSLAELEEFDAVYVATGAGGEDFGLLESWQPKQFTTAVPKVFMGGTLVGATLMEGIAQGKGVANLIEAFVQTGRAELPVQEKESCAHYLKHEGAVSVPRVVPSSPEGYTEEEARQEAQRCLQCDCAACMNACEMLKRYRKVPHKIAQEVYNDANAQPPFFTCAITRQSYSCNICGYCKSVCPEEVDLGGLFQLSRVSRVQAGTAPPAFHDFWLREMEFAATEGAFASAPRGRTTCTYAFFPGCQLGASNPAHVVKAYEFLAGAYDAGLILNCCGAPAYWAGDDGRLQAHIEKIRQAWREMGEPTLVFACATCQLVFSLFLPEINRVSLYELLARREEPVPAAAWAEAAVFDPCAARDHDGMQSAVRGIASKAGISLRELEERNRCCGYGGHIRAANPSLYNEIAQNRAAASDRPYIVYCANCREVFASRGKACAHVLDLVFGLQPEGKIPTLLEKRENSLLVKKELLKTKWGLDFEPETHPWDGLKLVISEEIQQKMEENLISAAELKEAIWRAEDAGDKFYDPGDGMCLCSLVKPVVTYWVQYREAAPGTYEVFAAYSHRIRFSEGE